ncbi:MAG: ABC transporter permease [Proteobacteria bacterium]|nr:ABC transporter permease [Pseudomonadota bacterium]
MREFSASPREMLDSLWRHRFLTATLIHKEVAGRYRGSALGLLWSFFHPLFMLTVYTFVFSVVFKARWGGGTGSTSEFALLLFAGLIIFNLFAECFLRAPTLILINANFVKKVVFPLEILPWITLGSAFFHALISLAVWMIAYTLTNGWPQPTAVYLPLILIPLGMMTMGISWALASLGVYLRDMAQIVGLLSTVLMFLSPIFYPVSALPESFRAVLWLNPLMPAIEMSREVLFWGNGPDWGPLIAYWIGSAAMGWGGFAWFQKTRKGFADVL